MIDALSISNYKAFLDKTIVLGHHTMFIGTHASGKTTILEALDVFFNHAIKYEHIRNKQKDVIIDIHIVTDHYKKVFSPPQYTLNLEKSSQNLAKLKDYLYLYMPKKPYPIEYFKNQCLSFYYNASLSENANLTHFKNGPIIFQHTHVMHLNTYPKDLSPQTLKTMRYETIPELKNKRLLLGVDEIEKSFHFNDYKPLMDKVAQVFLVSKQKRFINDFEHTLHPLYKLDIQKELDTLTTPLTQSKRKPFILVEGKTDVPWFEKALDLLNKFSDYRVLPCGGYGNITFVNQQLKKANFRTLVITDGDMLSDQSYYRLKKDVIEMYTDIEYLNEHLHTHLKSTPPTKRQFFKAINESDEIVKRKLSTYATHHLNKDHQFVKEIQTILNDYESKQPNYYK